jgi:hypothetical protein
MVRPDALDGVQRNSPEAKEQEMRSILLWMLGVPIPIIILIALLR